MLIDSHAHLDMKTYDGDLKEVLDRAMENGVTHIITVGTDLSSSIKALKLANKYDFISSTIGYHPHNADQLDAGKLKELGDLASAPEIVAWGEIGLDFFRRHSPPDRQIEAFKQQLETAFHFDLPVIIHDREAHKELFTIIKNMGDKRPGGVIHCFSGDYDLAMAFIDLGYYISIPGTVTYKKAAQVRDVAARIPLEYMLVETDSPYLAPVPKRGKRNEPAYVAHTALEIARLRGMDFNNLALRTSENTKRLFKL